MKPFILIMIAWSCVAFGFFIYALYLLSNGNTYSDLWLKVLAPMAISSMIFMALGRYYINKDSAETYTSDGKKTDNAWDGV